MTCGISQRTATVNSIGSRQGSEPSAGPGRTRRTIKTTANRLSSCCSKHSRWPQHSSSCIKRSRWQQLLRQMRAAHLADGQLCQLLAHPALPLRLQLHLHEGAAVDDLVPAQIAQTQSSNELVDSTLSEGFGARQRCSAAPPYMCGCWCAAAAAPQQQPTMHNNVSAATTPASSSPSRRRDHTSSSSSPSSRTCASSRSTRGG